jgi:hypothetical protein
MKTKVILKPEGSVRVLKIPAHFLLRTTYIVKLKRKLGAFLKI